MKKLFFFGAGYVRTGDGRVWHYGRVDGAGTRCRDNDSRRRAYDLVYAFGVVLGAPVMALFSSRFSLKHILLFLVTLCVMGNAIFTFSSSYLMLAVGRLVSGFPHGAFLASAPLSCQRLSARKVTAAVAGMVSGMTVANLVGIPFGTYLSGNLAGATPFIDRGFQHRRAHRDFLLGAGYP